MHLHAFTGKKKKRRKRINRAEIWASGHSMGTWETWELLIQPSPMDIDFWVHWNSLKGLKKNIQICALLKATFL